MTPDTLATALVLSIREVLNPRTPFAAAIDRARVGLEPLGPALAAPALDAIMSFTKDVAAIAHALLVDGASPDAVSVTIDEVLTATAPTIAEQLLQAQRAAEP